MKHNPYIGPRPFERGDQLNFFGREREARELQALINAEHEVLVYAQSGAGKTSLFNARVIPALEAQGFHVLPVARVGLDLPPNVDPRQIENIFIYSALLSLSGQQADPRALLSARLAGFLRERMVESIPGGAEPDLGMQGVPHPPVLVFDQFEELFTTHRERWREAEGFFAQVRAALDEIPELGVVFSMREDHIAALDPYLLHFARRLRARFRLEPLGQRGALAGITRPAECAGVPFAAGVAERLVEDLCKVKVQGRDGGEEMLLGAFVEPVQLQVVCSQLWANLPEDTTSIQWSDVSTFGDVDRALTGFYDGAVQAVAAQTGMKERDVRRWFREQLITQVGTRGLALRGAESTAGLPNQAVDILEDLHLVRAEARAGARWYEIAHDRLVDPILASNRAWERVRQTPLRTAARRWQETGEKTLLLRGKALDEAEQWIQNHPSDVEGYETEFVQASQQAERAAARRRRQWTALGIAGGVVVLLMAVLTAFAWVKNNDAQQASRAAQAASTEAVAQRNEAELARLQAEVERKQADFSARRAMTAEDQAWTAQQQSRASELSLQGMKAVSQNRPQLGMQLALQSVELRKQLNEAPLPAAAQALYDGLGQSTGLLLDGPPGGILRLAAQGDWLAAAATEGDVRLWNMAGSDLSANDLAAGARTLTGHLGAVHDLAFHPGGGLLATAGEDNTVRLWSMAEDAPPVVLTGHTAAVRALAFSEDGRWLASGGDDGLVLLWSVADAPAERAPYRLAGDGQPVRALAFQPGSAWLATLSSRDKIVRFWNTAGNAPGSAPVEVRLQPPADMLRFEGYSLDQLTFSPDGRFLAVTGYGYYSFMLNLSSGLRNRQSKEVPAPAVVPFFFASGSYQVKSAAFSPDGCFLAMQYRSLSRHEINLFLADPALSPANWPSFVIPAAEGRRVAFVGDAQKRYLASAGVDNAVRLWDLSLFYNRMSGRGSCAYGQNQVTKPDVAALAAAPYVLRGLDGDASALLDLPGQQRVAAAGLDGSVRLWEYGSLTKPLLPWRIGLEQRPQKAFAFDISPDKRWLVAYEGFGEVNVIDLQDPSAAPRAYEMPEAGMARSAAVSPDGRWAFFYMIGKGRGAYMLDLQRKNAQIEPFHIPESEGIAEMAFSPDGRQMAAIYEWNILTVWSLDRMDKAGKPALIYGPRNLDPDRDCLARGQMKVAYDPTGRWLVVANASADLQKSHYLYDTRAYQKPPLVFGPPVTGEEICARDKDAENIAFSPDGRWLAGPGSDSTVNLWDLEPVSTGRPPAYRRLGGFDGQVKSLAFSPDGSLLVAGSSDFSLRAWRVADFPLPVDPPSTRLIGHESAVLAVRFSPDGNWLASLGADRSVQVWRAGGSPSGGLPSGAAPTPWVRFSGLTVDSQEIQFARVRGIDALVVIGSDHALSAWPLDLDWLTGAACGQTRPSLLPEDRAVYFPVEDPVQACPVR